MPVDYILGALLQTDCFIVGVGLIGRLGAHVCACDIKENWIALLKHV